MQNVHFKASNFRIQFFKPYFFPKNQFFKPPFLVPTRSLSPHFRLFGPHTYTKMKLSTVPPGGLEVGACEHIPLRVYDGSGFG